MLTSRVTLGYGAAGQVKPEEVLPRARLERMAAPKIVAANGEQIRDLGEKDHSIQDKRGDSQMRSIQECERGQTVQFHAEGHPRWKHFGVGCKGIRTFETPKMKQLICWNAGARVSIVVRGFLRATAAQQRCPEN